MQPKTSIIRNAINGSPLTKKIIVALKITGTNNGARIRLVQLNRIAFIPQSLDKIAGVAARRRNGGSRSK
jgi:hypothetical protein